ncbi:MAG: hypothetical protein HDR53_00880 [Treponema sp.]|nr:hypothetical protein [Treponema sp.]
MLRTSFALLFLFAQGLCFAQGILLLASKAIFIDGVTNDEKNANEHGVFPVLLEWSIEGEEIGNIERIEILRKNGAVSSDYECIATLDGDVNSFIDRNEIASPYEKYVYAVNASIFGKNVLSNEAEGYGALTANAYMSAYNSTVVSSHDKLTLMHRKINLQKLGKEKAKGDLSGDVSYKATVRGFHGVVYLEYFDYSDNLHWWITGATNIRANILANGTMFGTVECSGMYPGKICYDNLLIKKGNAAGGYYIVEEEGFEKSAVGWNEIDEELIANEELEK